MSFTNGRRPYLLPAFAVHHVGHVLGVEVRQQLLGDVVAAALHVDDRLDVPVHVRALDRLRETVSALRDAGRGTSDSGHGTSDAGNKKRYIRNEIEAYDVQQCGVAYGLERALRRCLFGGH